ncbi:hypothetical protein D3C85_1663330 [compost metagenome]
MKGVVGNVNRFRFYAADPSEVGQVFGKCPARLPEVVIYSSRASICSLCVAAKVWHLVTKGRGYAVVRVDVHVGGCWRSG